MWYVIGLIWLALIAGIVWNYRKKREKQFSAHARKFEALLSEVKLDPNLKIGGSPGESDKTGQRSGNAQPDGNSARVAAAQAATAPVAEFGKKPRLLPQAECLLYFVFRTGLPDHEVFANLSLADVIEIVPAIRGYDRDLRLRKLSQQRLDLVICTRQLDVTAVVLIDSGGAADAAHAANARYITDCLSAAGIRLVRIDSSAPPRHHQVRNLVYGAPD